MKNQTNYPANHPYHKDANAFIKGLWKKKDLLEARKELMKPIMEKFNVQLEWDIPSEFWKTLEWQMSEAKKQSAEIGRKIINLNRRLEKLKWGYWAVEPSGERWGEVYPEQFKRKQELENKREMAQ